MGNLDTITKIQTTNDVTEPPLFKVIYLNDNQTSMEFVIDSLMEFFDYTADTAMKITQDIHETGSAVVAVLPHEIAEQKKIEILLCAQAHRYPLQITLVPDVE